jgi:hypothetical protein
LFVAMAGFSLAGVPGGPSAWRQLPLGVYLLIGLLLVAGLLVMTRLRVGYYLGLLAGGATAISGVIAWGWPQVAARSALPLHPGIATVVGLYLCMRVAVAHRMFGPQSPG